MAGNFLERKTLGFFVKTGGMFSKPLYSGMGHILMLHRVHPPMKTFFKNGGMETYPETLETILTFFLNNGYEVISLDEVYNRLITKTKNKKFIAITLDDGYADNYEFAWPLLKKYDAPFTIYVTTDFPERKAILWWYLLEDLLIKKDSVSFQWQENEYCFQLNTNEEKEIAFQSIRETIINTDVNLQSELFSSIFGNIGEEFFSPVKKLALSWDQIKELSNDPLVTIGAHTLSHPNLKKLSENEALQEISESKRMLEEKTGTSVEHFAYPFGSPREAGFREFELSKKLGFKTAVTLRQGNIFSGYSNYTQQLPRIAVNNNMTTEKLKQIEAGIHHFGNNYFRKVIFD